MSCKSHVSFAPLTTQFFLHALQDVPFVIGCEEGNVEKDFQSTFRWTRWNRRWSNRSSKTFQYMHPPFSINYQTAYEISLGISPTAYTLILSFLLVYHKQMALLKPTSCFNSISFEVRFKTDEILLENFIYDTMHFQMLEIWSSEFLKYIRSFSTERTL